MAYAQGFVLNFKLGFVSFKFQNPSIVATKHGSMRGLMALKSVELDQFVTSDDERMKQEKAVHQDSASMIEPKPRYAVVTGANKGIGLETVKQLASNGVKVVLTARDEKKGHEAIEILKECGISELVVFHQLDVTHSASIHSLVEFLKTQFGRLDILVNNAGISGVNPYEMQGSTINWRELTQTSEMAEKCLRTNYYGAKETTDAFLPLLKLSNSPRIVNVSSQAGLLKGIANKMAKGVFDDAENLTEDRIDEVLKEFMKDFEEGSFRNKGWPTFLSAYMVSKAAVNSYTRILARKFPNFCINCVCPGFVKTDINRNTGFLSVEEGAASVVRLALLPNGSPSGLFYSREEMYAVVTGANKGIGFETVKQLASNGVKVVLTARDENRSQEAIAKFKEYGLSDLVTFHQLDVTHSASIHSLVEFVKTQFGKLDILVNNAGISGINLDGVEEGSAFNWEEQDQTYEMVEECLTTNYYGAKKVTEAFLPLLQLSNSPRIVNVSSQAGLLKNIVNKWAKGVLNDAENLTEEKIDEVLKEFTKDFKENSLETKGWPTFWSAYFVSKAAMNSYTRILAKKHQNMIINSLCPGFVKTDINKNCGILSVDEGAVSVVRLALFPDGSPSGLFYVRQELSNF
ncbi:hypothetical protein V8G54_018870 [Vigna mungo]|uniref:Uncharacterized protein n=1 Tax=Vigna mungo TaxID=3915 RepID=A0AAQ3RV19_VIGMU